MCTGRKLGGDPGFGPHRRADGPFPAVGHYLEAVYFDGYDVTEEFDPRPSGLARSLAEDLTDDPWHNTLLLTAVDTIQLRYADQVERTIPW